MNPSQASDWTCRSISFGDLRGGADELLPAGYGDDQFADGQVLGLGAFTPCGGDGLRDRRGAPGPG